MCIHKKKLDTTDLLINNSGILHPSGRGETRLQGNTQLPHPSPSLQHVFGFLFVPFLNFCLDFIKL